MNSENIMFISEKLIVSYLSGNLPTITQTVSSSLHFTGM